MCKWITYHKVKSDANRRILNKKLHNFWEIWKKCAKLNIPRTEILFPLLYKIRVIRQRERLFTDVYVKKTMIVHRTMYYGCLLSFTILYERRLQSPYYHGSR